ncbi:MAG: tRNA pseudouridine(55) synthase TruB [Phormidesmis sp.]
MTHSSINGFINLNKPATWTSHDCVARVRRLLNTRKVGHAGTLDPLATGVLPLAVGRATRLIQYLPPAKAYRAVIRFGMTTATDDLEGEVLMRQSAAHLQLADIEALLPKFTGTLSQLPPMYSAIQVEGKRLYDLARQGKTADVPLRQVTIHRLVSRLWQGGEQPALTLDIDCGPGTYIRSLARDLGVAAGTGATLAGLVRSHSNGFDLANSLTLEALEQAVNEETLALVPVEKGVRHLSAIALPPTLAQRWCMGQKLALDQVLAEITAEVVSDVQKIEKLETTRSADGLCSPPIRITGDDKFLGIGEVRTVPSLADKQDLPHKILAAKAVFAAID